MRILAIFILTLSIGFSNVNSELENKTSDEIYDPLIGYNRVMTSINSAFYNYIMYPVSYTYDYIMPDPIQGAFSNFFDNLMYPIRLVNNLLQAKFENSWNETKRFLINTTVGFAGFSDAATMHLTCLNIMKILGKLLEFGVFQMDFI